MFELYKSNFKVQGVPRKIVPSLAVGVSRSEEVPWTLGRKCQFVRTPSPITILSVVTHLGGELKNDWCVCRSKVMQEYYNSTGATQEQSPIFAHSLEYQLESQKYKPAKSTNQTPTVIKISSSR